MSDPITTDLARQVPQAILDPDSGVLVERSDTAAVADLYRRIQEYQRQWKDAAAWARDAIIEAADERSEWSFELGGAKVKVDPPSAASIDWQMDELEKLEQILPPERYGELVQQTVVYKPATKKLQALARQAGVDSLIWKIITGAERRRSKPRYIRVSR